MSSFRSILRPTAPVRYGTPSWKVWTRASSMAIASTCSPIPIPGSIALIPDEVLLDPYARVLSNGGAWDAYKPGTRPYRNGVVVENHFDWDHDQPLNIPLVDSIIYEMHVRSFTRHPSSGVANPGTFAGVIEKDSLSQEAGSDRGRVASGQRV